MALCTYCGKKGHVAASCPVRRKLDQTKTKK